MLLEATGQGQHFQDRGQSFYYSQTNPKPTNNLFIFSLLSQINFLILSLPPTQTHRTLQMQ